MCAMRGHNPNNHASTVKNEEMSPMNNRTKRFRPLLFLFQKYKYEFLEF